MGLIDAAKDWGASKAFEVKLAEYLGDVGRVMEAKLDSTRKTIHLVVELKGESQPFKATLDGYEILLSGDKRLLRIKGLSTSKPWMDDLWRRHFHDRTFEIPALVAKFL